MSEHVEMLIFLLGIEETQENHYYAKRFIQHATNLLKKTTIMKDFRAP